MSAGAGDSPWGDGDAGHLPVMAEEVLQALDLPPGGTAVDATLGLGGHAARLLQAVGPEGSLIGLDRDPEALARADARLRECSRSWGWEAAPITLVHANFRALDDLLDRLDARPHAILFDLGVSSLQLDAAERGFSFRGDGPLDMRMDPTLGEPAAHLLNTLAEAELARILWEFGEERHSRRIARRIVDRRLAAPLARTRELAEICVLSYPPEARRGRIHPATRSFQALRIAVNEELSAIEPALLAGIRRLETGGRIAVLSYHSLEDRLVKQTFLFASGRCRCAPELPGCVCGACPQVRLLTSKPLEPGEAEISRNPRSRSARLRVAQKL